MNYFCPFCGNKVPDSDMRFCIACGEPLEQPASNVSCNELSPNVAAARNTSNRKRLVIRFGIVASLLAVISIGTIAFLLGSEDENNQASNQEDSGTEVAAESATFDENSFQNQQATLYGIEKLKALPVTAPVLFPTYLSPSLKLDPGSIKCESYKGSRSCSYGLRKGLTSVSLSIDSKHPMQSPVQSNEVSIRGHKALVYSTRGPSLEKSPVESSNQFYIFWYEDRDLGDIHDVENDGAYVLTAMNIGWDELQKMIVSLQPVDEIESQIPVMGALESVMFPGRYELLLSTPVPFPKLLPSKTPSSTQCSWSSFETDPSYYLNTYGGANSSYRIDFYSKKCSNYKIEYTNGSNRFPAPVSDLTGYITVDLGTSRCSEKPGQKTTVKNHTAFFEVTQLTTAGMPAVVYWCENDATYSVAMPSLDGALEIANSMELPK